MALSVKVALKQEDDAEYGLIWKAEVKDWSLNAQGDSLEEVLAVMERKIITYLHETFGTKRKISASVGLASARVEFECEIITGDGSTRAPLEKVMAAAEKITDLAEKTGKSPLTILKEAKAKLSEEKKKKGALE